jgi:hypothetical protein
VGKKRKNAVRTADMGMSSRGKGVFSTNFPELITEVAPLVTDVPTSWNAKIPRVRWAQKAGSFSRRMIVTRM